PPRCRRSTTSRSLPSASRTAVTPRTRACAWPSCATCSRGTRWRSACTTCAAAPGSAPPTAPPTCSRPTRVRCTRTTRSRCSARPTPVSATRNSPPTPAACSRPTTRNTRGCAATGRTSPPSSAASTPSPARSPRWTTERAFRDASFAPTSFLVAVGDRVAALAAEGAAADLGARRGLVPLPLARAHQLQHPRDHVLVEAGGDDLAARLLAVDVTAQDAVEHVVGRERILIKLVGAQLRRGRPRDHRRGDHLAAVRGTAADGVTPAREFEHLG